MKSNKKQYFIEPNCADLHTNEVKRRSNSYPQQYAIKQKKIVVVITSFLAMTQQTLKIQF